MAILLPAVLFVGCQKPVKTELPPRQVTVAHPIKKDVMVYAEFTGTLEAVEQVDIHARVQGYLEKVEFTPSELIKKGKRLFVIEQAPYQAKLEEAKAALESAVAERDLAKANLARATGLLAKKAISPQEHDEKKATYDLTEAAISAAEAQLKLAQINLDYTRIDAPISGMIGRNLVDAGNLVGPGSETLLATIAKIDKVYAYFNVNEPALLTFLRWRSGHREEEHKRETPIYMALTGETGYPHEGLVDYVDNSIDPETGTVSIRGEFDNPKQILFPGAFVRVRLPQEREKGAILVSEQAIGTDVKGKFVMLVGKDDVVEQRYVEQGPLVDGMRVIRKGLDPADRYVVNGMQFAIPGRKVVTKMASPEQADRSTDADTLEKTHKEDSEPPVQEITHIQPLFHVAA